ncbi:hypothetical protein [Arthrobacter flavus]|uniref:Antitoxin Xre/MbcA/ParS-like toxin-binding domain-containing protein n=1 Tax=Arthrobacter flavus TaxID=95172 RepID=A0ABW4QA58_9MICC
MRPRSNSSEDESHSEAVKIAVIVRELSEVLTPRIVAGIAGITDPQQVCEWEAGKSAPTEPAQLRLRFAHSVLGEIQAARRTSVAQAWAVTINPRLYYSTPVKAIREGRFIETKAAVQALLEEAYDG